MTGRSIGTQLLVAGIVPAAIIAVVIGAWFAAIHIADLRKHHAELGQSVVSQLAPAAEYGIFARDTAVLQRLADVAMDQAGLTSVTIRDHEGTVLARSRRDAVFGEDIGVLALWIAERFVDDDRVTRFTAPVIPPVTDLGEFDLPRPGHAVPIGDVEITLPVLPGIASQVEAALTGLLILLAGLLVSTAVALQMGKRIGMPIRQLAEVMRRFRAGDLDARAATGARNEIGMLEVGLNLMADKVQYTQQSLQERIEQATSDLTQTLEAMEISNAELDIARRRALEASHLKSEFLATMSHEIRTPLSGIIGYTRMLARTPLTPEQREQVITVERSASSLLNIINDILDLSRIEAGKLVLVEETFDVRACVDEAMSRLAPLAYERSLRLSRCVRPDVPPYLLGDRQRMQQVLTNLVSNAIKYTDEGSVSVEARMRGPGMLELSVTDTGSGIPADSQLRLFQEFAQTSLSAERMPGSGLGLAITNKLVEAMGGDIELTSEAGQGTRVAVTLKLPAADGDSAPAPLAGKKALLIEPDEATRTHMLQTLSMLGLEVATEADGDRHDVCVVGLSRQDMVDPQPLAALNRQPQAPCLLLLDSLDPAVYQRVTAHLPGLCMPRCVSPEALLRSLQTLLFPAPEQDPDSPPEPLLYGKHVLVADDNRIHRALLARQLAALGAQVHTAVDGDEAIAACEHHRYDAVLLDLQMPTLGGIDTARAMSAKPAPPKLVAVTANAMQGMDELREAGFSACLIKPADDEQLVAAVAPVDRDDDIHRMLAEDLPGQGSALEDAVTAGDTASIRAALHDLAGTAAVCRLSQLGEAVERLRRLQRPLRTGDLAHLKAAITAIMESLP